MNTTTASHVRSSSWPDDVHPLTLAIEDHLLTLIQSRPVCQKLCILKNLYEDVNDFLPFSMTREASTKLDDISDGFLRVLDICGRARDAFLQMKEQVIELESTMRRRSKLGDACLAREIDEYILKKRALSRAIERDVNPMMKSNEKKRDSGHSNVLKQVEQTSFAVLVSLLVVSQRHRGGGFVSKMFRLKNVDYEVEETDEIGLTEADMERLKSRDIIAVKKLQKLKETELKMQEVERDLECVYRKLLKTRVSLLNMLTK